MVIVFKAENIGFYVRFKENPTAQDIIKKLPIEGTVKKWGDEIYFDTGVQLASDGKTLDVDVGDVAYWPEGKSLCVFFGRTQASVENKPVPASPVIIVGKTFASPDELREIKEGEKISVFIVTKRDTNKKMSPYEDSRKLTQAEIDELVKKLLAERERKSLHGKGG